MLTTRPQKPSVNTTVTFLNTYNTWLNVCIHQLSNNGYYYVCYRNKKERKKERKKRYDIGSHTDAVHMLIK